MKVMVSCGCVTKEIFGAEKNKIVSNLLKSDEFKNAKKELKEEGYKWKGVSDIEVVYNITYEYNDGWYTC